MTYFSPPAVMQQAVLKTSNLLKRFDWQWWLSSQIVRNLCTYTFQFKVSGTTGGRRSPNTQLATVEPKETPLYFYGLTFATVNMCLVMDAPASMPIHVSMCCTTKIWQRRHILTFMFSSLSFWQPWPSRSFKFSPTILGLRRARIYTSAVSDMLTCFHKASSFSGTWSARQAPHTLFPCF